MKRTGSALKFAAVVVCLSLLISCGEKPMGYGVFLWGTGGNVPITDNQLREGQVYPVYSESNIRGTYELSPSGSPSLEVERWRLELFPSEQEALFFARDYQSLIRYYGSNLKNGQAIRAEADSNSERIYKLRAGQLVKIIEKNPEPAREGSLEGFWYRVLTEDGTKGYCFGGNLDIYDIDVRNALADNLSADPSLDLFLSKPFRPEEFQKMVREQRIDLSRFSPSIGVFPDREERRIRVVTPEDTFTFTFNEILPGEPGRFIFGDSGLKASVLSPSRVVLQYMDKGAAIDQLYVALDGMEELIEMEKERQDELFRELYYMGPARSSAYGTISFESFNTFVWENKERLIPQVIPEGLFNNGTVEILYFPSLKLKETYDGVLTFNFNPASSASQVSFLYILDARGLRLVYVLPKDIREGVVQELSPSPLIMFFSADNPRPREEEPAEETGNSPAE